MGIRGEPRRPTIPRGVWSGRRSSLRSTSQARRASSSASATRRGRLFHKHPWTIGGGGAAELKERLEDSADKTLSSELPTAIGFAAVTGEDEVFCFARRRARTRSRVELSYRPFVIGEDVRDWTIRILTASHLVPYD